MVCLHLSNHRKRQEVSDPEVSRCVANWVNKGQTGGHMESRGWDLWGPAHLRPPHLARGRTGIMVFRLGSYLSEKDLRWPRRSRSEMR